MTAIGFYPGCSLSSSAAEYSKSLKAVVSRLDVQLQEVPDWLCCGASSAHAVDHNAALVLAADTLAKASRAGMAQVLAPCAMCYQRLAVASHELNHSPELRKKVAAALNTDAKPEQVQALNLLQWLAAIPAETLKANVSRPLTGLKVACYYGCLLVRPPAITRSDSAEAPRSMEKIITALGATRVRWSMALECCGGSFALSNKSAVIRQGRRIYDAARGAGADVLALACPMCHSNFDMRQSEYAPGEPGIPALYLTQLIGLAFNIPADLLGLQSHFVPVAPALAQIGKSRSEIENRKELSCRA